ncbi:MAG: uroporphyrinogen-III synthase [Gemmatimonadetes bacterium]|nr:uroporphyrinogen-III synthase [Gemmatimonadota bacterium]
MSGLSGRRIVVTRAAHQAESMATAVFAAGGEPVLVPAIVVAPPESPTALDDALRRLTGHDWVLFTSANGVEASFARAEALGLDTDDWGRVRVAAVGPATAGALARWGVRTRAIPDEHRAERVVDVLGGLPGARVLLLRGDLAGSDLPRALEARGARVHDVVAYRTLPAPPDARAAQQVSGADVVTFTSASTVRGLAVVLGPSWRDTLAGRVIASIGPATSAAAREMGLRVDVEAVPHTVPGLIAGLERFWTCASEAATAERAVQRKRRGPRFRAPPPRIDLNGNE